MQHGSRYVERRHVAALDTLHCAQVVLVALFSHSSSNTFDRSHVWGLWQKTHLHATWMMSHELRSEFFFWIEKACVCGHEAPNSIGFGSFSQSSMPSLFSRFAGRASARYARASSAWAVVATLRETFYVPADPSLNQTVTPTDLVRA